MQNGLIIIYTADMEAWKIEFAVCLNFELGKGEERGERRGIWAD